MNNKPDSHPEKPESGQQANSKETLDISERGTSVPPHPQNGIKNTEMPSSQQKVDNCQTCIHFIPCRHRPHLGSLPEPHCYPNPTNIQPCPHYEPKQ